MTSEVIIPLVAGLIGTFLGSLASISTMWFQQRGESRRERLKIASELAMEDYKNMMAIAKANGRATKLFPISTFQHFHYEILTALDEGNLSRAKIIKIKNRNRELMQAFEEINAT